MEMYLTKLTLYIKLLTLNLPRSRSAPIISFTTLHPNYLIVYLSPQLVREQGLCLNNSEGNKGLLEGREPIISN